MWAVRRSNNLQAMRSFSKQVFIDPLQRREHSEASLRCDAGTEMPRLDEWYYIPRHEWY